MISLICAVSQNGVIGLENRLPWHLPGDLKRFKSLTMGHHVIMGRKTYASMSKPLPGRTNIVVTRAKNFQAEGCLVANSVDQAIQLSQGDDEVFIIGGATIYQQALPRVNRIYLTTIHQDFVGDTFLFELDKTTWQEILREDFTPDEKNQFYYSFLTLVRR